MTRDALISACGRYRYSLYREWALSPRMPVLWLMLNPSTADATVNDPTIHRCIAFSKSWGYSSMLVGNLFAARATQPDSLLDMSDPTGPDNIAHLNGMAVRSARIVCAWGAHRIASTDIVHDVLSRIVQPGGLWCLGKTKTGAPKHPLYLRADTSLVEYRL